MLKFKIWRYVYVIHHFNKKLIVVNFQRNVKLRHYNLLISMDKYIKVQIY